jgi:hypothetical protein
MRVKCVEQIGPKMTPEDLAIARILAVVENCTGDKRKALRGIRDIAAAALKKYPRT